MKSSSVVFALIATALSASKNVSAIDVNKRRLFNGFKLTEQELEEQNHLLSKDDEAYWERFLTETDMSIPNAPPTTIPVATPAPVTPAPVTSAPVTPAPSTPAPVTPAPVTPAPTTAPVTSAPVTSAPVTSAPVTPAPVTPAPVTPAPVTSAPITPAPVTSAPVTPAPVPITPLCNVTVETSCATTDDGTPCANIEEVVGQCAAGGNKLDKLSFKYDYSTCNNANNGQGEGKTGCNDASAACEVAESANITCVSTNTGKTIFASQTIAKNAVFTVEGADTLPDSLTCQISTVGGELCQEVFFDTSGTVDLNLANKFGHMTLVSCENENGETDTCFRDIAYAHKLANVGDVTMTIKELLITSGLTTEDLIDKVADKVLGPGDQTTVNEPTQLDLCAAACYETTATVAADPEGSDTPCFGVSAYQFCVEYEPACDVEVQLTCQVASDNSDCTDLTAVDTLDCTDGDDLTRLAVSFDADATCDSDNNQGDSFNCQDFACADADLGSGARISCEGVDETPIVPNAAIFQLKGNPLPDQMNCTISNDVGEVCQQLLFDTSGNARLSLKDTFGKFVIQGCQDADNSTDSDCIVPAAYGYTVFNQGENGFTLTEFRANDGENEQNLLLNGAVRVEAGETISEIVVESIEIDRCIDSCNERVLSAVGQSDDGKVCKDEEVNKFCIEAPESCDTAVDFICTTNDDVDASPCEVLPIPTESCSDGDRLTQLTMTFNGATTCNSTNGQEEFFTCEDVPGVVIPEGEEAKVNCYNAESVFCECSVAKGNQIELNAKSGGVLPGTMFCTVSNQADEVCQKLSFDTSGRLPLNVQDTFGKFTVAGCIDEENNEVQCLFDVKYRYFVETEDNITITELKRVEGDGSEVDFLKDPEVPDPFVIAGPTPRSEFAMLTDRLNVCTSSCNTEAVSIVGTSDDGAVCADVFEKEYCFDPPPTGPNFSECVPQTTVECKLPEDGDGVIKGCDEIVEPPKSCSSGQCLDSIKLSYNGATICDPNANDQGDAFTCALATDPEPATVTNARVLCTDDDDRLYCNCTVALLNGVTTLTKKDGDDCLPDKMTCKISTADEVEIQTVTFNPSANVALNLRDSFGALTVEGCSDGADLNSSCRQDIKVEYTLSNPLSSPFYVDSWKREVLDVSEFNLHGLLGIGTGPSNPLPANLENPVSLAESTFVDVCGSPACFDYRVTLEGSEGSTAGQPDCMTSDKYVFCVEPTVDVSGRRNLEVTRATTHYAPAPMKLIDSFGWLQTEENDQIRHRASYLRSSP